MAEKKDFIVDGKLNPKINATEITNWLKAEFELGHGHAVAIYVTFKGKTELQKNNEPLTAPKKKLAVQWLNDPDSYREGEIATIAKLRNRCVQPYK